jgi:site-specific DNA-methyltransferase (adenine-specific)
MINLYNKDCMEAMKDMADNQYDLAIVDPPYGINADVYAHKNGINCKANNFKEHKKGQWDSSIPSKEYFTELQRVSKNQIIWGGNYFTKYLKPVMSWIVWDKMQHNFSFSDGELAWNSFGNKLKIFQYCRGNESGFAPKIKSGLKFGLNIHPTQKPIALYEWLLMNYAKEGDKILDTHLGSGSIAIACHNLGYDLDAYEIDKEYYEATMKRFKNHTSQKQLWT